MPYSHRYHFQRVATWVLCMLLPAAQTSAIIRRSTLYRRRPSPLPSSYRSCQNVTCCGVDAQKDLARTIVQPGPQGDNARTPLSRRAAPLSFEACRSRFIESVLVDSAEGQSRTMFRHTDRSSHRSNPPRDGTPDEHMLRSHLHVKECTEHKLATAGTQTRSILISTRLHVIVRQIDETLSHSILFPHRYSLLSSSTAAIGW